MEEKLRKGLLESLNSNGFSFQYAVVKKAEQLYRDKKSPFWLEVSEFPTSINGRATHVDMILRHCECPFFLVVECKRSDPARSNWCFVRAPYVSREAHGNDERVVREAQL